MRRFFTLLAPVLVLTGCVTNPYSGESGMLITSESEELRMGVLAYAQISQDEPVSHDPALNAPLNRVGSAISAAADRWRAEKGEAPYEWEFKVIRKDDVLNAWCLPGGKIAFYTGIYPVCADEAGMAIVMGHEVSHALARHAGYRMTQAQWVNLGLGIAEVLARDSEYHDETMAALGAGATYCVVMPYSRGHESTADKMGLMLAAEAGYDPEAAIRVWQTMARLSEGQRPPEFLSTHPDPLNRVENMRQWMPEALRLYERSHKRENRPLPRIGR